MCWLRYLVSRNTLARSAWRSHAGCRATLELMRRRHGFQWPPSVHQVPLTVGIPLHPTQSEPSGHASFQAGDALVQVAVGAVLVTLIGTFFPLLAPALEPKALRIALQATYALLAAATVVLLVITTYASGLGSLAMQQTRAVVLSGVRAQEQPVRGSLPLRPGPKRRLLKSLVLHRDVTHTS